MENIPKYEISQSDLRLAEHLKKLRKSKGLSLDEVAATQNISRATLSRIERGETSPTAQHLGKLSAAYSVSMSQLLIAVEEPDQGIISLDDADAWRDVDTGFERRVLSPPTRGYDIELTHCSLPPMTTIRYDAPPINGLEQHIFVLSGKFCLTLNGEEFHLSKNDCLMMKLSGPTKFSNSTKSPALYLIANRT